LTYITKCDKILSFASLTRFYSYDIIYLNNYD